MIDRGDLPFCDRCKLRTDICICSLFTPLKVATSLVIVMHKSERLKPTNTARIVEQMVPDCAVRLRGELNAPLSLEDVRARCGSQFLLFPDSAGVNVTTEWAKKIEKPLTLIVPDGTWQQAKRMTHREPGFRGLPRLTVAAAPTRYRLRKNAPAGGMCTLEAIAYTLAVLEGPEVCEALLSVFDTLVERVSWARSHSDLYPMGSPKSSRPRC